MPKQNNFDGAIGAILDNLAPHERKCRWNSKSAYCEKNFKVTEEDIKFYHKLRVPPPALCPSCRRMRRLGFGLILRFYKQQCQAPNHKESVISVVSPGTNLKIYDWDYYRKYEWEPLSYAVSPNKSRPFFDVLLDLRRNVPQPAIVRDPANIDSDYTINGRYLKHGYFVSGGWNSERIYYSVTTKRAQDCMDCYFIDNTTYCYENTFSRNLNTSDFIYFSNDCYSCRFMYDSKNCNNCFGCVNLRNRTYCFFNEQLTKDEYEKRLASIDLGNRSVLLNMQERFWKLVKSSPIRATRNEHVLNVLGNHITESRNCYESYVAEKCENIRFGETTIGNKDSMDYAVSGGSELLYETVGVGSQCSNVKFSFGSKFITDSEFVINCRNVSNCFGCIGLENQSYCIFNKKYEPEEYVLIVDGIKSEMLARGEYGEFFPFQFSPYAYNDSFANLVFPLSQKEVEALGGNWRDDKNEDPSYVNLEVLQPGEIPESIDDAGDEVLGKALMCEATNRPFRIISDELNFYRRKRLPLPTIHPNERIKRRYMLANPYRLYDASCGLCGISIKSMYKQAMGFLPYCEQCYRKEFA